jgi:alpha-beta hydrolase superfamily lysophospholipase
MAEQGGDTLAFADAVSRFRAFAARDGDDIAATGRSLLLSHERRTPRAFVLLHGLTAVPAQWSRLAPALHATGANVFVPRLPRHGHSDRLTRELAHLTPGELTAAARDIVETARGLGEHLTIAGFSAGGMLGAWIAQNFAVDRAVCIAPLLGLERVPLVFGGVVARAALRAPNAFLWWHPVERERHGAPHGYPRFATHAVASAWKLGLDVLASARRGAPATRNIVLVRNAAETTVSNKAIALLADAWRSHIGDALALRTLEGLPRSHDIIEPQRPDSLAAQVEPDLLAILAER